MSDAKTVKPGEAVTYHVVAPELRIENPDHDSLFLRMEQLDALLENMESSMTCCRGAKGARVLLALIRAQVLK